MDETIKAFCDDYMANEICQSSGYVAPSDSGLSCWRCMKALELGIRACVDAGTDYNDPEVLTDAISVKELRTGEDVKFSFFIDQARNEKRLNIQLPPPADKTDTVLKIELAGPMQTAAAPV